MRPAPAIIAILAATLALLAGCSEGYDNNDAELAVRQKAKETCSCVFVQQRSETYCAAWTKVSPNVATASVDRDEKRVTSVALGFYKATAAYKPRLGCVLES